MRNTGKRTTTIPFTGFYESIWSRGLDDAEEQAAQYLSGDPESDCGEGVDGFKGLDVSDVCTALFWCIAYPVAHAYIAKQWAETFAMVVDTECGWATRMRFDALQSPKEYNHTTDRIFMTLPRATVRRMRKECDTAILVRVCREQFTSCSGFASFYPNNPYEWGPLDRWDHNQIAALLDAWLESQGIEVKEVDAYSEMHGNGDFDEAIDSAYSMDALRAKVAELADTAE